MKIYITFGPEHVHKVNGKLFDKFCLAEIECKDHASGRLIAHNYFGTVFGESHEEDKIEEMIAYFPRGIIKLEQDND